MVINESNIMWKDSNGFVRKWIDQKTGDVMEHDCYIDDCDMVSLCCGVGSNEYIDGMCGGCNEMVTFECIDREE